MHNITRKSSVQKLYVYSCCSMCIILSVMFQGGFPLVLRTSEALCNESAHGLFYPLMCPYKTGYLVKCPLLVKVLIPSGSL
jgi:hypothetical protein